MPGDEVIPWIKQRLINLGLTFYEATRLLQLREIKDSDSLSGSEEKELANLENKAKKEE